MHLEPVQSSNIAAIGYDPESQTLAIRFHGGSLYEYAGVPASLHRGLMNAQSKGGYLHEHIKGRYTFTRRR